MPNEFPAGYFWYDGKRKGTVKPPKWVEKLLDGQEGLSSEEEELESPKKDITSDTKANEAIDEVWEAKLVENDGLAEPEPVKESEKEPEVTSSSRNSAAPYTLRQTIKPPEDTHEGHSG